MKPDDSLTLRFGNPVYVRQSGMPGIVDVASVAPDHPEGERTHAVLDLRYGTVSDAHGTMLSA